MNRAYYYILTLILALIVNLTGQAQTSLSGYVTDAKSGERLIGAHVWEPIIKQGQVTNGYGYFTMTLPKNTSQVSLHVSYIGYKKSELPLTLQHDTVLTIALESDNVLGEVEVTATMEQPIQQRENISLISIPTRDIAMLPALGGERDILKAYQLMPGVQAGNEGSSGLYVRGGSPDQNLMLLDDAPLYYVNHLGGFTSIFNNDAINSSKLYKGGFPARYGGRLSSVFDVKMKEGNNNKHTGAFTVGMLTSKILAEGPLGKGSTTYLISVRRFMYDLITRPVTKLATGNTSVGYTFWDANLKLNHTFSNNDRLFLSAYFGDDKLFFTVDEEEDSGDFYAKSDKQWGNNMVALRWNHLFNAKLFSNTVLSYTRYRYLDYIETETTNADIQLKTHDEFFSGINDVSLKPVFEYFSSNALKLTFGGEGILHYYNPGKTTQFSAKNNKTLLDTTLMNKFFATEGSLFLENDIKLPMGLRFNLGLRFTHYNMQGHAFNNWQPRAIVSYLFNDVQVKLSYSKMMQPVHLLTSSGVGIPIEFWVPATPKARPGSAQQAALGMATTLFKKFEFSAEAYYKEMDHLITFKEGASYFGTEATWEEKIETRGKGQTYGLELLLQKKQGRTTGWLSYTLSKNMRQFHNINQGRAYPFKYDRRHEINLVFNRQLTDDVQFSASWVFASGEALTLPAQKFNMPVQFPNEIDLGQANGDNTRIASIHVYPEKNSMRSKPYHRLDIGFNFSKVKPRGTRTWNLSIYNLYNRKNPYYYYLSEGRDNGKGSSQFMQQSLFPFMPSVSYSFRFR